MYKIKSILAITAFGLIGLNGMVFATPLICESSVINSATGVLGTAPKDKTVTSAGFAVQEMQNSTQAYVFFSQTLSNQIFYEARLWGAYNYMAQNPIFTSVSASNIQNPPGYGTSAFIGYNFHTTDRLDITPYFRVNYFRNMAVVYEDSNGNFLHSTALAGFIGSKFTFKELPYFTPYLNFWVGFQQVAIVGNLENGPNAYNDQTATVDQIVANTQIGLNFKVSNDISMVPYWQYMTVASYPDSQAAASPKVGGFGISSYTATQQIIGLRLNVFW